MKPTKYSKSKKAGVIGFAILASLAFSPITAFADSGHGSIRGADRNAPPPPPPHQQHAPQPPPHAPAPPPHGAPPEIHDERDHHDQHVPPPPPAHDEHRQGDDRHDWDYHDDDRDHWGGYAPRPPVVHYRGEHVHDLSFAHVAVVFGGISFVYDSDGYYYQPQPDGQYVIVQPPIGAVVPYLPGGIIPIPFGGTTYFYLDGVYYTYNADNTYTVVNPPFRIIVPALPGAATQLQFKDVIFYQFNGYNYTPVFVDGTTAYMVTPIS
jgi:hypothetical protein